MASVIRKIRKAICNEEAKRERAHPLTTWWREFSQHPSAIRTRKRLAYMAVKP